MKRTTLCCLLSITGVMAYAHTSKPVQRSVGYTENKGQIVDQYHIPNPNVRYLLSGNGLNVQLKTNGFCYDTYTVEQPEGRNDNLRNTPPSGGKPIQYHFHRVEIEFIGAHTSPEMIVEHPIEGYTNYYTAATPSEGVTGVRTYQQITYKNLYDGIDLQFTVNDSLTAGQSNWAKYNFIIHPGADASRIQWRYKGAFGTALQDGTIQLSLERGILRETIPASFLAETETPVAVTYRSQQANTYGFAVGSYDTQRTLIIDPIPWATYFGGSSYDLGNAIAIDPSGNVAVAGYTGSSNTIASAGAFQTTYGGNSDAYVAKFNSAGIRLWGTYYGGNTEDIATGIAADKSGNLFITGTTYDSTGIATPGTHQVLYSGGVDVFLVKFSPAGTRIWGTYYGGTEEDRAAAIAADTSGNVIITGYTASASGIATPGAYQTMYGAAGGYDVFVAKFNTAGGIVWGTYYGGTGTENSNAIATDPSGNIVIIGVTNSLSGIATAGAFQTTYGGGNSGFVPSDAFIAKFSPSGARLWGTYYGNVADEVGQTIATGASGNIYIAGWSWGTGLATSGAYQTTGGSFNYPYTFIGKFTPAGTRVWCTYYGTFSAESTVRGITTDANENVFIAGVASTPSGSSAMVSAGASQTTFGGGSYDGFLAKFTTTGSRAWGTYYGGSGADALWGITTDPSGNAFVVGSTSSPNAIAPSNAYQAMPGGGDDVYLAGFTSLGRMVILNNYITGESVICGGASTPLTGSIPNGETGNYTYLWQQSTTGSATGFTNAVGINHTQHYTPPVLTTSTWFRRIVFSGTASDTSFVFPITVYPIHFAGFTVTQQTQCARTLVQFQDTSAVSAGNLSLRWNFGEGNNDTSTLAHSTKRYDAGGSYTVKLIAVAGGQCADTVTQTVTVYDQPQVGFTVNDQTQCLSGNNFVLNDTSSIRSGALSRLWTLGDSTTSSLVNPTKYFTQTGTYNLKLVVRSDHQCVDSVSKTVTVYNHPHAGFVVNNASQCLDGNRFVFDDTTAGAVSRTWYFGDFTSDHRDAVAKTYTTGGQFTVSLTIVDNHQCADSLWKTVTVYSQPRPGFVVANLSQCLHDNHFVFDDTTSGIFSRTWSFGDSTSGHLDTVRKSYAAAGLYTVSLTVVDSHQCLSLISKTVTVYNHPRAGFVVDNRTQCLLGNRFGVDDTTSGSISRTWNFGDSTSNHQDTVQKTYTAAGHYTISLTVVDSHQCADSTSQVVTVKPSPAKPVITALSKSQLQSTPAFAYQWFLNSTPIAGATSQTLILTQNGSYRVATDSSNGCSNTADPFIASSVGIGQLATVRDFSIYPNPVTTDLFIYAPSSGGIAVEVYDVTGKKLMDRILSDQPDHRYQLNVQELTEGFYFMLIDHKRYSFVKVP